VQGLENYTELSRNWSRRWRDQACGDV